MSLQQVYRDKMLELFGVYKFQMFEILIFQETFKILIAEKYHDLHIHGFSIVHFFLKIGVIC
jgi:hypothetical protein